MSEKIYEVASWGKYIYHADIECNPPILASIKNKDFLSYSNCRF